MLRPWLNRQKNQGATSILVIIMMVVLVVLGLAILTTSLSGMRLAQKKQDWLKSYYSLEKQSATALAILSELTYDQSAKKSLDEQLNKHGIMPYEVTWSENGTQGSRINITFVDPLTEPRRYITVNAVIESTPNDVFKDYTIHSYRQWQDDFVFVNLPGFDDPLTTPPEFNLPSQP